MQIGKLVVLSTIAFFGTAMAGDEVERKVAVKVVVAGDNSSDSSGYTWSSDAMDFDMQDLEVGETRVLDNESGKTVSVTRGADGYSFDIDGKTIEMPDISAHGTHMAFVSADDIEHEIDIAEAIDIEVMGETHVMGGHRAEGVTIISSKPLDSSVRESIKSVLVSAGNGDEVTFIDGTNEENRVIMMKKKVDVH